MGAFFNTLLGDLPSAAYGLCIALIMVTVGLVRCSLHPTIFALVAWPGTLAHELCHASVGLLLGAKPCSMTLWPKSLGNGSWQLGSVGFAGLTWWNGPWTAMAPMLLAPVSLLLTLNWAYPVWASGDLYATGIALYVCATLLQASWPSSTDFKVAFPGLVITGLIVAWLW